MAPRTRNLLILAAAMAVLIAVLASLYPDTLRQRENLAGIVSLTGFTLLLGSGVLTSTRMQHVPVFRYALIWLAIGLLVVTGYAWKDSLSGVWYGTSGALFPDTPHLQPDGSLTLRKAANGHFQLVLTINDVRVRCMVDTGASDIILPLEDAERLGFDPESLSYTRLYTTANGQTRGAPVTLEEIRLDTHVWRNVPASVIDSTGGSCLLGMRFLDQLDGGYRVQGSTLILYP